MERCTLGNWNEERRENVKNCLKIKLSTYAGFEPTRAEPSRFRICLLNHSDNMSYVHHVLCTYTINSWLYHTKQLFSFPFSPTYLTTNTAHLTINQCIHKKHVFLLTISTSFKSSTIIVNIWWCPTFPIFLPWYFIIKLTILNTIQIFLFKLICSD